MSRSLSRTSPLLADIWPSFVLFAALMTLGIALMFVIVLVA